MKAGLITAPGRAPCFSDFTDPKASPGFACVQVTAAALSHFSRSRSSGSHYSSNQQFPCVAGADGVGRLSNGQRVYFVLPEHPFGSFAEQTLVSRDRCVPIPDHLDDYTAAALANPGMSAWAALFERAQLKKGETVLVNGGTSTAGRLAIQLAKYRGASRIMATGRNEKELQELTALGADVVIPLAHPDLEGVLIEAFASGIDVVVDYLWGISAQTIIVAIARAIEDGHPVRFVHVGAASQENSIELPGAALRSSAIQLMGSGVKSVPFAALLRAIQEVFNIVGPARLQVATTTAPLASIEELWDTAGGKPRLVFTP